MAASSDPVVQFDLEVIVCDGTHSLAVSGELDIATATRLTEAVEAAIDAEPDAVVVDLTAARFIDSSGIRALVTAHRMAVDQDVPLSIVPAPHHVHAVFVLCGLEALLPFVRDAAA